ncbi:MAG: N-acetylmuramoyl-L-alanine amidase [Defluviitaleaceae bacterium]|nr:N-acetylmuramoyl-L-alanine amidase [Defluviitaleaceae bacterium]
MKLGREWTIVLDAGHGGHDPGAVSDDRIEKNDNLMFARVVEEKLRMRGQNVIMTRTGDTFVSLRERVKISNRNNADLFVSLHRNYSEIPETNGVEVYVTATGEWVDVAYAQTVFNKLLDENVQSNGGMRQADIYVLRKTYAPAMQFEIGYTSNPIDNELFLTYIDDYAETVARGIVKALERGGELTNDIYIVQSGDTLWQIAQWFRTTVGRLRELNRLTGDTLFDHQILMIPYYALE